MYPLGQHSLQSLEQLVKSLPTVHRAKMATDLARSIVAEAQLHHRSEMITSIKQSRAILMLKSLKPCQAVSTSGYSSWNDTSWWSDGK